MNPIEWIMGHTGMPFFFGTKRLRLTQDKLRQAENIDKYIKQRAKTWVNLKHPAQPPTANYKIGDYDKVIAVLDNPMDANPDITQVPEEMRLDFIAKYLDIRAWLDAHQPAIKFSGGLIATELPPPDSDKAKFMWAVDVLDNLTKVLDMLDAGCLTPIEAQAVREVFPEFTMGLIVEYVHAVIGYLLENDFRAVSGWKLAGLSALAGVPITSFQNVMAWQANYETDGTTTKAPNLAASNLTEPQKLEAPI